MPDLGILLIGLLFGVGFGFFTQRSGLCFAHGLGEIFMGRGRRIARMFLVIFIITALGFALSGVVLEGHGLKPVGVIRGHGLLNLLSGMIFGAGILLCGGCILGTLRQIGEGNATFLIVLASMVPGMALVVFVVNPLLESGYAVEKVVVPDLWGADHLAVAGGLALLSVVGLVALRRKR